MEILGGGSGTKKSEACSSGPTTPLPSQIPLLLQLDEPDKISRIEPSTGDRSPIYGTEYGCDPRDRILRPARVAVPMVTLKISIARVDIYCGTMPAVLVAVRKSRFLNLP